MKNYKRFFLYLTAVFVLGLAGSQITVPGATAAATCCEYGYQCGTGLKCCAPGTNEANCSQNRKYYCRASCTAVIIVEPVDPVEPIGGVSDRP